MLAFDTLRNDPQAQTMVDVGAHTGGSLGPFAVAGWQVYAFEPDDVNRAKLKANCTQYAHVNIDPRAVTNETTTDKPFYRSEVSTGISGLSSFHPSHKETGRVSTVTLDRFYQEQNVDRVDFLKIDTEGFDLFVLKGVPWDRVAPRMIMCEFEDRKTVPLGYSFADMANFLAAHGYDVLVSEWYPIIEYGRRHKWRRFAWYPTPLAGGDQAFGNLIAVRNPDDMTRLEELVSPRCTRG